MSLPRQSVVSFFLALSFLSGSLYANSTIVPSQAAVGCTTPHVLCVGQGQAYSTIQDAANVAQPGDTVLVLDGTYDGFHTVTSGSASAPIIFKANSENVIINSAGDSNGDNINIEGQDYIVIDGFTVVQARRAGIRVALAVGVVIQNNHVSHSGEWGIFTAFAQGVQLLNNQTFDSVGQHGIYVSNSDVANDNPIIRGNESYGNAQNGIQLNGDCETADPDGYTDGVISNAIIENNRVHDNGWKGLSLINVSDSFIANNLLYNNGILAGAGGIHLADQGCGYNSNNNALVNNTIVEPRIAAIRITSGVDNVIFNNITISGEPIVDEYGGNNIDLTSNVQSASTTGLFVDAASNDYHLIAGSAAIDRGRAAYAGKPAPLTDYEGNARPRGGKWDSGAYEFVPAIPPCVQGCMPHLVVYRTLRRDAQNAVVADLVLMNTGGATAASVSVTGATIGASSATGVPTAAVDIAPGASTPVQVVFSADVGVRGGVSVLVISGTYNGGSFKFASRTTVP